MSGKPKEDAAGTFQMERRIIQIDPMADQAGITAALRRAFANRQAPATCPDEQEAFAALLRQIH